VNKPPSFEEANRLPPRWAESQRFVPRTFVQPALTFMRNEAAGGIFMLVAAVAAIVWANSAWGDSYFDLFSAKIEIAFGHFHFHHLSELTVQQWINDALMAIFFFVVGLEIKRELVVGELRDPKAAALPAIAALGGMVVPALLFLAFNGGTEAGRGWGIPMATDIAFAVGVISMVGTRVPIGAKLFLLALAIVDDLGAILVIALFYTTGMSMAWLAAAVGGLVVTWLMNRGGIRSTLAFVVVGGFVWLAFLESGIHATVAGVALALLTPLSSHYEPRLFAPRATVLVRRVDEYLPPDTHDLQGADHHTLERVSHLLNDLKRLSHDTLPPLDRLEFTLSPWASFVIVPLFALANAGVRIPSGELSAMLSNDVTLGVAVGLFVGKLTGVLGASYLAIKLGLGRLPRQTTWHHMIGVALLAGIGFTVALFVSALSFSDPLLGDASKIGIFAASLVAGVLGFVWLRYLGPAPAEVSEATPVAQSTADVHAAH
jgi:Na+:H+ antiporter, NhaA family